MQRQSEAAVGGRVGPIGERDDKALLQLSGRRPSLLEVPVFASQHRSAGCLARVLVEDCVLLVRE